MESMSRAKAFQGRMRLGRFGEQSELSGVGGSGSRGRGAAVGVHRGLHAPGSPAASSPGPRRPGDSGQLGHVQPVAAIGAAGFDVVEEHDAVLPFADRDVEVADRLAPVGQCGQLVVVRGEQRPGAAFGERFGDGPGQRQAVEVLVPRPISSRITRLRSVA